MEQIIIVLLVIIFGTMLAGFWYFNQYLNDIHEHLVDEGFERDSSLAQSFLDGYYDEERGEQKVKKRKNAK